MPQALLPGYLSGPTLSVAIQGMPLAREQRKLAVILAAAVLQGPRQTATSAFYSQATTDEGATE